MKRPVLLAIILLSGLNLIRSFAADRPLDILAAREQLLDFIRTTDTRLADLEEAIRAQQKRILNLENENRSLQQELIRLSRSNPAAGLEQGLKALADDIKEVDRKRLADNKLTLDKLKRFEDLIRKSSRPAPVKPQPASKSNNTNLKKITIQKGDSLYKIVAQLRNQGVEVSAKAIEEANPGVVWTRLQIGQDIYVPVPKN